MKMPILRPSRLPKGPTVSKQMRIGCILAFLALFMNAYLAIPPLRSSLDRDILDGMAVITSDDAKTEDEQLAEYCRTHGSLHNMALRMAKFSSPPGSDSYNKMLHIMRRATRFQIRLDGAGSIFWDVAKNLAAMMEGFGLKQEQYDVSSGKDSGVVLIETVYSTSILCDEESCDNSSRIIVQSEQLWALGKKFMASLQACHHSPTCVIWDFSDYNYRWAIQNNISNSFFLLPVMTQSRLGDVELIRPLWNRSLDVVFFGSMTPRRKQLKVLLDSKNWSLRFERTQMKNHNKQRQMKNHEYLKESYADAKVCLITHAYREDSAGEYHRLSEISRMGCVPVMETISDSLDISSYERCGTVTFSDLKHLPDAMEHVLQGIKTHSLPAGGGTAVQVEWWRVGVNWSTLLSDLFGRQNTSLHGRLI
jgi:hypothetical protein